MASPRPSRRKPAKSESNSGGAQSAHRRSDSPGKPEAGPETPAPSKGTESISFDPSRLDRKIITIPLAKKIVEQEKIQEGSLYKVIIDLNLTYHGGRDGARDKVLELLKTITAESSASGAAPKEEGINSAKSDFSDQYLFGQFTAKTLYALVARDKDPDDSPSVPKEGSSSPAPRAHCAIHLIWPDFPIAARLTKSVSTVKADAARRSFSADGSGIVWAVLDSGIQGDHIHFVLHSNLATPAPLVHRDFTQVGNP